MSNDENTRVVEALQRLEISLRNLPDKQDASHFSHWRRLPEALQSAYNDYIRKGAELCKATSTKYTLVGKINADQGAKLAKDLLQGCELIATGVLVICNEESGCGRAARHSSNQAARGVVTTTRELVHVFATHQELTTETIAAIKTGAVWNTCDLLLKIPQGNRNATRRELFTMILECNETLEEFTQLLQLGANDTTSLLNSIPEDSTDTNNDEEETTWDDFCEHPQQYSVTELPIATAALCLVKCSRGSLNVTLKACESVGNVIEENGDTTSDMNTKVLLDWIKTLTNLARTVGNGMTDLGTCLYPPLVLTSDSDEGDDGLQTSLFKQRDALVTLNEFVLDAPTDLPEEVLELASKLKGAATTRYGEAQRARLEALEAIK